MNPALKVLKMAPDEQLEHPIPWGPQVSDAAEISIHAHYNEAFPSEAVRGGSMAGYSAPTARMVPHNMVTTQF